MKIADLSTFGFLSERQTLGEPFPLHSKGFHHTYQFGGDTVSLVLNDLSSSELPFWVPSSVLNQLTPKQTH